MQPRVNKWLDLLDRVGWTAVQAAGGVLLDWAISDGNITWRAALYATIIATGKVLVGQRTGSDNTGSLIGTPVIEPPPK